MTDRRAVALFLLGPWFAPEFWDDVDYEIATLDPEDLADFQAAEHLPVQPRPGFEQDLRKRLYGFAESRYRA